MPIENHSYGFFMHFTTFFDARNYSNQHFEYYLLIFNVICEKLIQDSTNDKSTYKSYWDLIIMYKSNLYWSYRNYNSCIYSVHRSNLSLARDIIKHFLNSDQIDRRFTVSYIIACHRHKSCYQYHLVFGVFRLLIINLLLTS